MIRGQQQPFKTEGVSRSFLDGARYAIYGSALLILLLTFGRLLSLNPRLAQIGTVTNDNQWHATPTPRPELLELGHTFDVHKSHMNSVLKIQQAKITLVTRLEPHRSGSQSSSELSSAGLFLSYLRALKPSVCSVVFSNGMSLMKLTREAGLNAAFDEGDLPIVQMLNKADGFCGHQSTKDLVGVVEQRSVLADPFGATQTFNALAQYVRAGALPSATVIVARARRLDAFQSSGGLQRLLHGLLSKDRNSAAWLHWHQLVQEARLDPAARHEIVFFTPESLVAQRVGGLGTVLDAATSASHVVALLQAAHGQIHPQGMLASVSTIKGTTGRVYPAPLAVVDISDTAMPVHWAPEAAMQRAAQLGPGDGLYRAALDVADEDLYGKWVHSVDPASPPLTFMDSIGHGVTLVASRVDAAVLATGFDSQGGVVLGGREVQLDESVVRWHAAQVQSPTVVVDEATALDADGQQREQDDRDDKEQLEDDDDARTNQATPSGQPIPCRDAAPGPQPTIAHGSHHICASPSPRPLAPNAYKQPGTYLPPGVTPLLTMFTTMFASHRKGKDLADQQRIDQKNQIQRNTLLAARHLFPKVEMIVFSEDESTRELCGQMGVFATGDFDRNPHGTPFLKSMYQWVEKHTRARMYGYMNADILFGSDLIESVEAVLRAIEKGHLHERVLLVGRRTNFAMPFPLNEDSEWMFNDRDSADYKMKMMAVRGQLFQLDAQDFFFITRGAWHWNTIPNFVIGRIAYDNWLVDHAFHDGLDRVDITSTAHAVHQTGVDGNKAGFTPRPDKNWNRDLGQGKYDHGLTSHCNFHTEWGLDPRTGVVDRVKVIRREKWHPTKRKKAIGIPADNHIEPEP